MESTMPWTEITRLQYRRDGLRFASDTTDTEWALLQPLMPAPAGIGRPRTTDLRAIVNAILYVLATGCQWRALGREFPPRSTVQGYFYTWRETGLGIASIAVSSGARVRPSGASRRRRPASSTARA